MKPLKKIPEPEDRLHLLTSETARLYWEGFIVLSLSIDGYLLMAPPDPLVYGVWWRLMIATSLLGYILGIAPILVRALQRRLDTGDKGTSKLIIAIFIASCCGALLLEPILRLISATQLEGKRLGPALFLIAFVLLQLIRSRKEIKELLTTNRSGDARAPMVALSLRLTYLIAVALFRASLGFAALTISSRGYSAGLYAGPLVLVIIMCSLFRKQQE